MVSLMVMKNQQLRILMGELEHLAHYDSLTGLLNRQGLMRQIDNLPKGNKNFLIYYLDLNDFKDINDSFILISCPNFNTEDKMTSFWDTVYQEFKSPFKIKGHDVFITFSLGVASYSADTDNIGDIISKADHQIYLKKKLYHEELG